MSTEDKKTLQMPSVRVPKTEILRNPTKTRVFARFSRSSAQKAPVFASFSPYGSTCAEQEGCCKNHKYFPTFSAGSDEQIARFCLVFPPGSTSRTPSKATPSAEQLPLCPPRLSPPDPVTGFARWKNFSLASRLAFVIYMAEFWDPAQTQRQR